MSEVYIVFLFLVFAFGWAIGFVFGYTKGMQELDYRIQEYELERGSDL